MRRSPADSTNRSLAAFGKLQHIRSGWLHETAPARPDPSLSCLFLKVATHPIARICNAFLAFEETEESKIFDNAAFGYWKVTVDRPLRVEAADPNRVYKAAETKALKETSKRSEDAPPVLRKIHKRGTEADPLRGLFAANVNGRPAVVEYEPDTDLRDTEQIPLQEDGGIEAFLRREVLPYAADAWHQADSVKVGYEISFTRYFYKPKPMRTLAEIRADILALEQETEGLLAEILGGGEQRETTA